jgi:hypothetical protein
VEEAEDEAGPRAREELDGRLERPTREIHGFAHEASISQVTFSRKGT